MNFLILIFFRYIYTFYNCIVPLQFLTWENRVAVPRESQLRQRRATQPTLHVGCFKCFHDPPNYDMDYRIFNSRRDVNACDCTQKCTDTSEWVCIEIWLWEKNPLPHRGIELRQRRAGVTRENNSPRQINPGVKLAYSDLTFSTSDYLPPYTRELLPREILLQVPFSGLSI